MYKILHFSFYRSNAHLFSSMMMMVFSRVVENMLIYRNVDGVWLVNVLNMMLLDFNFDWFLNIHRDEFLNLNWYALFDFLWH